MITNHSRLAYNQLSLDEYTDVFNGPIGAPNGKRVCECIPGDPGNSVEDPNFYGGIKSLAGVRNLLDNGWRDGAERLADLRRELHDAIPAARTRKRTIRWSGDGDELSVDRALRGQWDSAWRTTRRVWTAGAATVDLLAFTGGPWYITAEQMFWTGAASIVAADVLESAGYNVRIITCSVCECEGGWVATLVTIKDAHEPLRIDMVASVLCHAAVHRTHTLRARCALPISIGDGMGATRQPAKVPEVETRLRDSGAIEGDAIIMSQAYDRDAAIERVRAVLARVQGE